ncbi:MAG TPA: hypothetical protein VLA43_09175 [Longimicrobiales bacterium]|nr:hypothetical protein [Longimicrobiales bacterium]
MARATLSRTDICPLPPSRRPFRARSVAVVLLSATLSGCASGPRAEPVAPQALHLPGVTQEWAWDRVVDLVVGRGWSVEHSEREGGLITTEWLTANDPNRWMDCGRAGLLRKDLRHQGRISFTVRPAEDAARVAVSIAWVVAREETVNHTVSTERCVSLGTLEADIRQELLRAVELAVTTPGIREPSASAWRR